MAALTWPATTEIVVPATKPPSIVVSRIGPEDRRDFAVVALELDQVKDALRLAKVLSERTGRTVIVRDQEGEHLGTFRGTATN
jgi:hypothetical protein